MLLECIKTVASDFVWVEEDLEIYQVDFKYVQRQDDSCEAGIISSVIFKGFDCVEWPTLKIIKILGFGERFKDMIDHLMYSQRTLQEYWQMMV